MPLISRKGSPNIKGLGKLRYVVEQTFALLHHFKRLALRWERRTELHDAFVSLACNLIVSEQARTPAGALRILVLSAHLRRGGGDGGSRAVES